MNAASQEAETLGLIPTCSELLVSAVEGKICIDWHRADEDTMLSNTV